VDTKKWFELFSSQFANVHPAPIGIAVGHIQHAYPAAVKKFPPTINDSHLLYSRWAAKQHLVVSIFSY
jgi:hypothetical protein